MRKLKLPQSSVSTHVKKLLDSRLVVKKKRGKNIFLFPSKRAGKTLKEFADKINLDFD